MKFSYKDKECDIEVFSNDEGIVVKFFNAQVEPTRIVDYVYVDAGYGYMSLKRKNGEGILSGLLKKEFFNDRMIIEIAIDFVIAQLPNSEGFYIPYNLERVVVYDAKVYTGETSENIKVDQ